VVGKMVYTLIEREVAKIKRADELKRKIKELERKKEEIEKELERVREEYEHIGVRIIG